MNKELSMSCPNYFDRLRYKAREIDEGLNRLTEIWKTPHLLIGGYAERSAETNSYLEELWELVRGTNNTVEKYQLELEPSLEETDQLLEQFQAEYDDLKKKCDGIDTVLAEYGYHYEEDNDNIQESYHKDDGEKHDMEVEFTPNLTWKCKSKSKESDISISTSKHLTVTSIPTPVIKSVASVLETRTLDTNKGLLIGDTPMQKINFSKHLKALRR